MPTGDVRALRAAITQVLLDPRRLAAMAESCRRTALTEYRLDVYPLDAKLPMDGAIPELQAFILARKQASQRLTGRAFPNHLNNRVPPLGNASIIQSIEHSNPSRK